MSAPHSFLQRRGDGAARIRRPVIAYTGGKWQLAPWVISHFPQHKIYVEPFGGAGSVLLRKTPALHEIYNDVDGELVNLFRVLRNHGAALRRRLALTAFARDEYELAQRRVRSPIERAARAIVRCNQGFGANGLHKKAGWRGACRISDRPEAFGWANHESSLQPIIQRLRRVTIENRDAIELIRLHDCVDTLFYVDPPYLPAPGRTAITGYQAAFTEADHARLLEVLRGLYGKVVVSGYDNQLYRSALAGWRMVTRRHHNQQRQATTECLWISPAASAPISSTACKLR